MQNNVQISLKIAINLVFDETGNPIEIAVTERNLEWLNETDF